MKSFFSFLSKSSQKRILCLDGGGVRTIAALVFLKKLESESGKKLQIYLICLSVQVQAH